MVNVRALVLNHQPLSFEWVKPLDNSVPGLYLSCNHINPQNTSQLSFYNVIMSTPHSDNDGEVVVPGLRVLFILPDAVVEEFLPIDGIDGQVYRLMTLIGGDQCKLQILSRPPVNPEHEQQQQQQGRQDRTHPGLTLYFDDGGLPQHDKRLNLVLPRQLGGILGCAVLVYVGSSGEFESMPNDITADNCMQVYLS